MASVFDHIHLKKKTLGSPNELSFDVLDKARNELDGKEKKTPLSPSIPKQVKQSFHGAAGASSLSGQAEVAERKNARLKSNRRIGVLAVAGVAVVAVGVVAALWSFAPRYVQEEQHFDEELDSLVGKLVEIDGFMAKVDVLMEDPFTEESRASYSEVLDQIEPYQKKISSIRSDIAGVSESTLSDDRKQALKQLDSAAEARASMLTAAGGTINLAAKVDSEVDQANSAWTTVLEADEKARTAALQANTATTEKETVAVQELTREAYDEIVASQSALQEIVDRHVGIDLAPQMTYLKAKTEALEHALAAGEALLEADRSTARSENEAYNEADTKATSLAEQLPSSVEEPIRSAFDQEIAIYEAKYQSSRDQAISADAVVRSYLNE